jgi:hypothetical protein
MSEEQEEIPYVRKKRPKRRRRGRPKKVGRPRVDKQPNRDSPGMRQGARFKTITLPEEAYLMLKELAKFYEVSIGNYAASLIVPAFMHAQQEAERLQRIEENREKAKKNETPIGTDRPRRTHF